MKFRVKQIKDDAFIPQCKPWYDFEWGNIDREENYIWHTTVYHSICPSLDTAYQVIIRYKTVEREKKQYPKYHKV